MLRWADTAFYNGHCQAQAYQGKVHEPQREVRRRDCVESVQGNARGTALHDAMRRR